MTAELRDKFLRNSIIKQIISQISFGELVKIVHSIAEKETDEVLSNWSEEEKEEAYKEILSQEDKENQ
jgi:hypothetical protein